jgi:transposase
LDRRVKADDRPELHSFVRGIEADYDAVRNGLALTHNFGAVEGHVNRTILWNQSSSI